MEVTLYLLDVMAESDPSRTDDGRTTRTVTITPETTIADVGTMLNLMTYSIEYERYYRVGDLNTNIEGYIPFVISDGHVRWDVPTQKVLVADFLTTFGIESNKLYIRHGWPAAGGPGPADIVALWNDFAQWYANSVHPFLTDISPELQGIGTVDLLARLVQSLVNRFSQKVSPGTVFSLVASRPRWTAADLARTATETPGMADMTPDEAKTSLALCRYKYIPQLQMYEEQPESEARIAELNGIRWTRRHGFLPRS